MLGTGRYVSGRVLVKSSRRGHRRMPRAGMSNTPIGFGAVPFPGQFIVERRDSGGCEQQLATARTSYFNSVQTGR